MTHRARARAHANIALVKYWGKRPGPLNLPAAGSLSLTLEALTTTTEVVFDGDLPADDLVLGGTPAPTDRLTPFLDLVRARAGIDQRARVVSDNDFPTASGLASSASAFAALALAASRAAGLDLDARELSILARRGSGSAARSIFGGLVIMHAGERDEDAYAEPLAWDERWPLRMVIAIVGGGKKKEHSSRLGMGHCAETSPLYAGWLASVPPDLAAARAAIAAHDLEALGAIAEGSALAMHAAAIASRPSIIYWQPPTLACIATVQAMRRRGVPAWFTIDAGPHVKVLTDAANAHAVAAELESTEGVTDVILSGAGGPAQVQA